ncbi:uncharacterized protein si:dkey-71d15.2 isoform X1 [Oreochromis aureus]|uniref:uncharacterized protein si:dkey-71d15.2 isoform X1 n=1 Tax=Oreochromis aureus TaxID=47969 RepID=UPI001954A4C7|nr:uncharacterized protein si:dkey-71d15.2 isoform X1 [Oreochromis aureus]
MEGHTDLFRLDSSTLTAVSYQDKVLGLSDPMLVQCSCGFLVVFDNVLRKCRQFLLQIPPEKIPQHTIHRLIKSMSRHEYKHVGLEAKTVPTESFSSLLPKAISAVLHPAPPAGINSHSQPSRNPEGHASPNLEQLQTELRDLKGQFEQMKTQHNKEIKLLMNELDEEKRIRLTLQMEIQRMKKHMSK